MKHSSQQDQGITLRRSTLHLRKTSSSPSFPSSTTLPQARSDSKHPRGTPFPFIHVFRIPAMNALLTLLFLFYSFSHFGTHDDTRNPIVYSSPSYRVVVKTESSPKDTVSRSVVAPKDTTLKGFLSQRAVDGTILLMMVDAGYLNMFINSYKYSNLSQYKNLVVLCIDPKSFRVFALPLLNSRFSAARTTPCIWCPSERIRRLPPPSRTRPRRSSSERFGGSCSSFSPSFSTDTTSSMWIPT